MKKMMQGFLLAVVWALPLQAERLSLRSMKEVSATVEGLLKTYEPQKVLVVFDVDMTLTRPDHPAVSYPFLKKYISLYKALTADLTPEEKDMTFTLTTQDLPQRLVEKSAPSLIRNLQKKGVKTLVLTASLAGDIPGFTPKMVMRRRDQLQVLGLDFTQSFKNFGTVITFHQFPAYAGGQPLYYHGILSSNGEGGTSKGEVFTAYLKHLGPDYEGKAQKPGYYPQVVVFVDDKEKQVENVEEALNTYDPSIQFIGITYGGAYEAASRDITEDEFKQFWENLIGRAKSLMPPKGKAE